MLLWQPEGFYKECRKSWYRHNLVQKENSETRLRAVAFRFLIFSFPLLPLLVLWTQALLRAQLCHLRRSSAAAFSCRRSSRGSSPSPIAGWAANAACSSRSSFAGPPYPKQVRAFAWATPAAALSAVVLERRVVRTGGGDAVAPSSSRAATEADFCSVCVCLSLVWRFIWKSCVSYLTTNDVSGKTDLRGESPLRWLSGWRWNMDFNAHFRLRRKKCEKHKATLGDYFSSSTGHWE